LGLPRALASVSNERMAPIFRVLVPLLLVLGLLIRGKAISQDLWLDEIWSILDASSASSLFAATFFNSDNNHPLNSAYLYSVGLKASTITYRLPAFLFGILLLGSTLLLGSKWSRRTRWCLPFFYTCSYLIVLYSTEARGYAGLLLAMAACQYFMELLLTKPTSKLVLLGLFSALLIGILSHGSFLFYVAALVVWVGVELGSRRSKSLVVPLLLMIFASLSMYVGFYSKLPAGTGTLYGRTEILLNTASLALGLPPLSAANPLMGLFSLLGGILTLVTIPLYLTVLRQSKNSRWFLCFILIVAFPLVVLFLLQPRVLFVRYFLISIVGYYWLFCLVFSQSGLPSWLIRLMRGQLVVFLLCNSMLLFRFWNCGRGQSLSALSYYQ
jgi:hypothetical protein